MQSEDGRPQVSAAVASRFRAIVDEHFAFIWRMLRGLGVPAASVDDAAQQVFVVASQKLESIAIGSERSFLLSTAMGVAANARRAQARSREVLDDVHLQASADEAPSPEQAALTREARTLLASFLESLEEDLRAIFVMFELEGMTTAEIARCLSIAPGTAASRLRRAREEFRVFATRVQTFASKRGGR